MTKYILHGGKTKIDNESNRNYNKEIINGLKEPTKILIVCFAKRNDEEKKDVFERHMNYLIKNNSGKKIDFAIADENSEKFDKQIINSDVIYIVGGSDKLLQSYFKKINNLINSFKNKVVIGSSAGANLLSKYYYSTDNDKIEEGLGILPIKVFCHYKNNEDQLNELKKYKENLKTYVLPETKYYITIINC